MFVKNLVALGILAIATLGLFGCGKSSEQVASTSPTAATDEHESGGVHEHGEWWCGEHGMPEEVCGQCSTTLAADFKAKGDWCEEHDRPDSQCFVCHPEKQAEFAALYEAKYGKQSPQLKPEEEEHDRHEHDEAS